MGRLAPLQPARTPVRVAASAMLGAAVLLGGAAPAHAASCAGVELPARLEVAGTPLVLNGVGLREVTFLNVDVYVAGLYLPGATRDPAAILALDGRRTLELQLVRDVTREEMMDAFTDGMRASAGSDFPRMQDRMRRLAQMLPELTTGSRIRFDYAPDQGITLSVGGDTRGTLEGDDFARALFAIWIGDHAVDADLRRGLLGGDGC